MDVASLLSQKAVASSEPLAVSTSIQSIGGGRFTLTLVANGQTRKLDGASCNKLAEAAALLIALLLDPNRAVPDAAVADPPEPKPSVADDAPKGAPRKQVVARDDLAATRQSRAELTKPVKSMPFAAIVEAAVRLDGGSWPMLEPGVVAGIGLDGSAWRILMHAGIGRRIQLRTKEGATLQLVPITFNLEPAFKFVFRRWSLEPGVGVEFGITHSYSDELAPRTHDALSLLCLALLRGKRDLGAGVAVWAEFGAGIPLLRPRWIGENGAVYHAFGPLIRGEIGLQLRF